jgi:hypothetical protein
MEIIGLTVLVFAKANRICRFFGERVFDVLAEALFAKIELFSLIEIIRKRRCTNVISRFEHLLKLIEMVSIVNDLSSGILDGSFDFDRECVSKLESRINISFATITTVANHGDTP